MTSPLPSYYIPDFELELQGQPIPADLRASVTRVHFEESLEAADRVEVEFANQGLRLLDNPLFELGTSMQLSLGYQPTGITLKLRLSPSLRACTASSVCSSWIQTLRVTAAISPMLV